MTVCSCVVAEVMTVRLHHCDQPPIPYSRVLFFTLKVKHRPLARATDNEICFFLQRTYLSSLIINEQIKPRRSLYLRDVNWKQHVHLTCCIHIKYPFIIWNNSEEQHLVNPTTDKVKYVFDKTVVHLDV